MEPIKVKVMESLQEDAYKGIARINTATMKRLGVKPGDVIIIKGGKESVAIVDKAFPADVDESVIRIDGLIRRNAKTGVGETVTLKKAEIKEAKKIIIAPAQKGIRVQAELDIFKRGLLGRAVVQGDLVTLGNQRKNAKSEDFDAMFGGLSEIFGEAFNNNFGQFGQTRFVIVNTNPKTPVIITENTTFILNPSLDLPDINEDGFKRRMTWKYILEKWGHLIITLKTLPSLVNHYEVKDLNEFIKLLNLRGYGGQIINYYKDKDKKFFFVGSYYYSC